MTMKENLSEIKKRVCKANLDLPKAGLVKLTWGNASEIDRDNGLIIIKPSGVDYKTMSPEDMVVTDLDGKVIEGKLNPSSDLPTHVYLYKKFKMIGGIVHTHSSWAVSWAQAGRDIPVYGTTHADHYYGPIPCARELSQKEVDTDYEKDTGKVIVETLKERDIDPLAVPGVLVKSHGPFVWGKNVTDAVKNAIVLDDVAFKALCTEQLLHQIPQVPQYLMDKHYLRKHGPNAYYGQNKQKITR